MLMHLIHSDKWITLTIVSVDDVDVVLCSEFPLRLFSAVVTVSNVIFRRGLAKPVTVAAATVPVSYTHLTLPTNREV